MESKIFQTLSEFGLSKNEIKVYIEAVKHKEISPYKLSKLIGIPRTTVYEVIMSLSLKGLITIKTSQGLEKQQTWIVAKNPSVLREIISKRKKELTNLEIDIVDILPELKDGFLQQQTNSDFQFFPGIDGVKKVFDLLRNSVGKTQIYMFDHMMPMDTLGKKFINKLVINEILLSKKAGRYRIKAIFPFNDWTKHVLSYQFGRDPKYIEYHEFRYLENPAFNLYQDIYFFSDRMAITMAKDDEVWGLIIKSRLLYKSMHAIFHLIWQQATPVTKEFVLSLGQNEFLQVELKTSEKR